MNEPTKETLARRLDRAERENRRLKMAGLVALVVIAAVVLMGQAVVSNAAEYEIESCQFITNPQRGVPPGLDEPLNCDHKCFYDELGIDILGDEGPNLHDMYSIGWNLVQIIEKPYQGKIIWWVYLERAKTRKPNKCDEIYKPKRPSSR